MMTGLVFLADSLDITNRHINASVIVVHGFRLFVPVRATMFHHPISESIFLNCIMMSMLVKNLCMTVHP